jgi:CHAP domain
MTSSSLLRYARSQIGYVERPVNRTKFGRQFGQDGILWCLAFVWCCFENSDNNGLVIKTASTRELYHVARRGDRRMKWLAGNADAKAGDLVEFHMGGNLRPVNHIGIVERQLPDGRLVCIEGNTGGRGPGGERNGGMVARKIRDRRHPPGAVPLPCRVPGRPPLGGVRPGQRRRHPVPGGVGPQVAVPGLLSRRGGS